MAKKCCNDSGVIEAGPVDDPAAGCASIPTGLQPASCGPQVITTSCAPQPCPPQPYYKGAAMCPEDTKKYVSVVQQSQVFKTTAASAVPGCGQSVNLQVAPYCDVPFGALVWANGLGQFRVVGGSPQACTLEIENECPSNCVGQAAPGTPIPVCTLFILGIPDCDQQSQGQGSTFPFLAADFVAPDVGDCIDIAVTNVNGISVNKNVSINGGIYRVDAVVSATIITICNDGAGLTPGTIVDHDDAAGNLIVPIILVDANPCNSTEVFAGVPLVCAAGVATPLHGSEDNQVLVWDEVQQEANFRTLGVSILDCTVLTQCLTLDPANPPGTEYLVFVQDTSAYTIGQLVTIQGTVFQITDILDGTTMRLLPLANPTAIQTYEAGAVLCSADCCTSVVSNLDATASFADAVAIGDTTLNDGTPLVQGNEALLTLFNLSPEYSMGVHVVWHFNYRFLLAGAATQAREFSRQAYLIASLNPADPPLLIYDHQGTEAFITVAGTPTPGQNPHSWNSSFSSVISIPAGGSATLKGRADMVWGAGDSGDITVQALGCRISALGIALKV